MDLLIEILRHRDFRHLFLAQVVALVCTGLATVALALLAYDLAGDRAGALLGTALAIKMAVYVVISPLACSLVMPRHRKREIGRAHVCTPVTIAHCVFRLLLDKPKTQ